MQKINKKTLKSRYAEKRQTQKELYKKENGSAKGWKSSDEFKRINKNEKRAFYRYERKQTERIGERIVGGTTPNTFDNVEVIAEQDLFFNALNYRGEDEGSAVDQFRLGQRLGKKTVGIIKDFDGNTKPYKTDYSFSVAIQDLYKRASELQVKETRKIKDSSGKTVSEKVTTLYPVITIMQADNEDEFIVTVEAELLDYSN